MRWRVPGSSMPAIFDIASPQLPCLLSPFSPDIQGFAGTVVRVPSLSSPFHEELCTLEIPGEFSGSLRPFSIKKVRLTTSIRGWIEIDFFDQCTFPLHFLHPPHPPHPLP